jgi:pimeloyl-ACP methyl ester carboxylesterase
MQNIVLIHGAWHQPRCWDELRTHIKGFAQVHTPDMVNQISYAHVNFQYYLNSLTAFIAQFDKPVILVGHSFAGFVITQYAKLYPEKVSQLIYINGFIPQTNHSLFSLCEHFEYKNLNPYLKIEQASNEISISSLEAIKTLMYNCAPDFELKLKDFRAEPFLPLTELMTVSELNLPLTKAIISEHDLVFSKKDQIKMCETNHIPYQLIDADHCPFLSTPKLLGQLLLEGLTDV